MASHRYWQAVALEPYGTTGLDISEFQLFVGTTRVDATATLTSNLAPATGAVANLQDDTPTTFATWSAAQVKTLVLSWDFGASGSADVSDIRIGSSTDPAKFLVIAKLQYADTLGTWTDSVAFGGLTWPGATSRTSSTPRCKWVRNGLGGVSLDSTGLIATYGASCSTTTRGAISQAAGVMQFEVTCTYASGTNDVGVQNASGSQSGVVGSDANGWSLVVNSGNKYNAGTSAAFVSAAASGSVIGVVVDFTAGSLTFYKNGVSLGVAFASGLTGPLFPAFGATGCTASTMALRTSGFAYPITGATAWDTVQNVVTGNFARSQAVTVIASAAQQGMTFGSTVTYLIAYGRKDYLTGVTGTGMGQIAGTTNFQNSPTNTPVSAKVFLIRERDNLLIRAMWSSSAGVYSFNYIDELQTYTVLAYDPTGVYRAIAANNLTPTLLAS